ncbi:Uncharacterised protein [Chryseobacterium nakagawai]|nr:Uncharacterised protein [Chryseobacterium nakagawai]
MDVGRNDLNYLITIKSLLRKHLLLMWTFTKA